jgi:hypothetical protein
MWDTRARVHLFGDGDTIVMESDMGRDIRHVAAIRLLGVWAPESDELGGPETAAFVREWMEKRARGLNWPFIVTTIRQLPRSGIADQDKDKKTFDRWLGTITTIDQSESLGQAIIEFVHANGYGGGTGAS